MQESDELLEQQLQILQQVRLLLIAVSNPFISQSEMHEKFTTLRWGSIIVVGCEKCSQKVLNSVNSRRLFYEHEHFIWTFFTSKVNKKCYSVFIYLFTLLWLLSIVSGPSQWQGLHTKKRWLRAGGTIWLAIGKKSWFSNLANLDSCISKTTFFLCQGPTS